jgi:hypothetical protein
MALNIKARITLDGILSFINTELKGGHDDVVIEFLEEKLNYVTQMKEKLDSTSEEEDHIRETFSRVKEMHSA